MQSTKVAPPSTLGGRRNKELAGALSDARCFDFDLPSVEALRLAEAVLAQLTSDLPQIGFLDVAVGEDGTTEITAISEPAKYTIDVNPTGTRIDVIRQDVMSGAILLNAQVKDEIDVVRTLRATGAFD